jgi:hypothetical protein
MSIYNDSVYYVYFYLREDNTPYYVGKGKGKRSHKKRKGEILPPKDKSRIIILHDNLSEVYAFILERYYIRWFGRKDNDTGILRNRTDGGEGHSGIIVPEENKKYGSKNHFYGKTHTDEYKQKITGQGNPFYGKTHSDELKLKWSKLYSGENNPFYGKKHSMEFLESRSKKIKSPDGTIYYGMRECCRVTGIGYTKLRNNLKKNIDGWEYII